jgi:hypothetical protein
MQPPSLAVMAEHVRRADAGLWFGGDAVLGWEPALGPWLRE